LGRQASDERRGFQTRLFFMPSQSAQPGQMRPDWR
jgi:hypothetical protein